MSNNNLRTGEVAARAGVSIATLRYYERRGLIPRPSRTPSGYRAFDPETVRTVRLIKAAQALGFTLKEIHALLDVALAPDGSCAELYDLARAKEADLTEQLESLQHKRAALTAMLGQCSGDGHTARDCAFVRELEASSNEIPDPVEAPSQPPQARAPTG